MDSIKAADSTAEARMGVFEEGVPGPSEDDRATDVRSTRSGELSEGTPIAPRKARIAQLEAASKARRGKIQQLEQRVTRMQAQVQAAPVAEERPGPMRSGGSDSESDDEDAGIYHVKLGGEDQGPLGIEFKEISIQSVDPAGMGQVRCAYELQPGMILRAINGVPADRLAYNATLELLGGDIRGLTLTLQASGQDHAMTAAPQAEGGGPVRCDDSSDDDEEQGICHVRYSAEDQGQLGIEFKEVSIKSVDPQGVGQLRCAHSLEPGMVLRAINGVPAERLAYNAVLELVGHHGGDIRGLMLTFQRTEQREVELRLARQQQAQMEEEKEAEEKRKLVEKARREQAECFASQELQRLRQAREERKAQVTQPAENEGDLEVEAGQAEEQRLSKRQVEEQRLAKRRRFEAAEATLGAPILGISKAALIDIQRQWLSEPCEIVTALRDVPVEDPESGVLPLVEGHVITVLSKTAGEVFHAVVDGRFTIVDVDIPEGWYAGSDNDAFGRQGIFPAGACGAPVDCHDEAFAEEEVRVTYAEGDDFGYGRRESDEDFAFKITEVDEASLEEQAGLKVDALLISIDTDGTVDRLEGVSFETVKQKVLDVPYPFTLTFRQRKRLAPAQLLYAYKAQMIKRILDGGHGRVALSDTLAGQTTPDGRLIVDSATLFLSHAWMMETGEFLDVTIANMGEEDYAWIDIFVYPQFSEGDGSTGAWIERFDNMIVGIGKVAVMNRWSKPIPLERIWCLFELVCAMRSPTTELLIVLSEAERQSLRAGLIKDQNVVTQMLVDIDVEEAKAEQESDHRQLSAQFREMEGGYHRANVELKAYLRDGWVLPALPVLVVESAAALGEGAGEAARRDHAALCHSVGAVFGLYGQQELELAHYEMDLEIRLALQGPEGEGVAGCYGNMGLVHREMREHDRALELYSQAAAIYEAKAPGSVGLAITYNDMGMVHQAQKDYARALERFGQAAAIYEAKDPDKAASTYHNMANVYSNQKDYGKSLEYHRKTLAITERVYGPRHPITAAAHLGIGFLFKAQGDHAGALDAYDKSLAIDEQVFGPQSDAVAHTCGMMAESYEAQGERERARAFYERAAAAFAASLGPEDKSTARARRKAAQMAEDDH